MKLPPLGEIKKVLAAIPGACVAIVGQFALTGQAAHIVTAIGVIAGLLGTYFIGPNDPPAASRTLSEAIAPPQSVSQAPSGTPET